MPIIKGRLMSIDLRTPTPLSGNDVLVNVTPVKNQEDEGDLPRKMISGEFYFGAMCRETKRRIAISTDTNQGRVRYSQSGETIVSCITVGILIESITAIYSLFKKSDGSNKQDCVTKPIWQRQNPARSGQPASRGHREESMHA
jgi:hypothetical protein